MEDTHRGHYHCSMSRLHFVFLLCISTIAVSLGAGATIVLSTGFALAVLIPLLKKERRKEQVLAGDAGILLLYTLGLESVSRIQI